MHGRGRAWPVWMLAVALIGGAETVVVAQQNVLPQDELARRVAELEDALRNVSNPPPPPPA